MRAVVVLSGLFIGVAAHAMCAQRISADDPAFRDEKLKPIALKLLWHENSLLLESREYLTTVLRHVPQAKHLSDLRTPLPKKELGWARPNHLQQTSIAGLVSRFQRLQQGIYRTTAETMLGAMQARF